MLKNLCSRRARQRALRLSPTQTLSGVLTMGVAAGTLLGGCGGGGSGPSSSTPQNAREILVFQSDRTGDYEIYTAFGDGKTQLRLTRDAGTDIDPALRPDRQKIAFTSTRSGSTELYLMNADGTGVKRLTNDKLTEAQPTWSPDGTRLAFRVFDEETFNSDIVILDVATGKRRNLTQEGEFLDNRQPTWSPDGTRIAYASDYDPTGDFAGFLQIYVRPVAGGEPKAITSDMAAHTSPTWSPDGTQLAFVSDADGDPELFISHADGSQARQVTNNSLRDVDPVWSRDGKCLIFSSSVNENFDLYSLNLSDGALTRLTTDPAVDGAPDVR